MRITLPNLADIEGAGWDVARTMLVDDLRRLQTQINRVWEVSHHPTGEQLTSGDGVASGTIIGTLAEQPTGLGARHSGLMFFVTDYGHWVRWTGTVWAFADEGGGYIQDFAVAPQAAGWALCDGSSTTRLVVGAATLTAASFTTPDLIGSGGAYRKGASAYGSVTAAGATGAGGDHDHGAATGSTAPGVSGSTASESAHTHGLSALETEATSTAAGTPITYETGANAISVAVAGHAHFTTTAATPNTAAGSAHSHAVGTLAVASHDHSITTSGTHTHTAGDPRHIGVMPYFRR